jgi:hypothetical protein
MASVRPFYGARAGLETTRGTNVAPTRGIPFTSGAHIEDIDLIYPEELRNNLFGHYAADVGTEVNALEFEGIFDFNYAHWWSNVHIAALATPTGAGADRTWTFLPSGTADNLKSATMQIGHTDGIGATQPALELGYLLGDQLTLRWEKAPGQTGLTFRSRLITPEAAQQISAFTGVGTYTAQTGGYAKAIGTALTIDTTTIGTTADVNVLSLEWTLNAGFTNLYTLNNSAAAQDTFRTGLWGWTATVRRYVRNDTEWDARRAGTTRKIRLTTLGPVLGSSNYSIALDLYGKYSGRTTSHVDGLQVEELTLVPVYDATLGADFRMVIVNDQTTVT